MKILMTLMLFMHALPTIASEVFPDEDWNPHPKSTEALASPLCEDFYRYAFLAGNGKWHRTDSVVVIKDGLKIFELYAPRESSTDRPNDYFGKFDRDTPHILWSASKSVTGTVMGAALQQGMFGGDIETRISQEASWSPDHKERWFSSSVRDGLRKQVGAKQDSAPGSYERITIADLLYMQSGFAWDESYGSGMAGSNVINMVYADGIDNMVAYTLSRPMAYQPGEMWQYTSGNSSLLMGLILRHELGSGKSEVAAHKAPWRLLFDPLKMKNAVFEPDNSGNFVGSSYAHLRPVDMAKIGYLYLKGGKWRESQLLPTDWVRRSSEFAPSYKLDKTVIQNVTSDGVYGMTWWLNKSVTGMSNKPQDKPNAYADIPEDFYGAFGHYGQYIFVLPSWNMVVVRTADDREPHVFDVNKWLTYAKSCFVDNPVLK